MMKNRWIVSLFTLAATVNVWGQFLPQPDKDGVYSAGSGVTPAKLVHAAAAVIPADPALAQVKHVCAFRVVVGIDGIASAVQLLNQHASPFDDAALASVKQSQFRPAKYQGKPVPAYLLLWVPFNVGKEPAVPIEGSFVRNGVSPPAALNSVAAEFPKEARKEKVEGFVIVQVLVSEEGLPTNAIVVRPSGHGFDEKALEAVGKYRFKSATLHGVPVPVQILVEVRFRL